ncbi:MAG: endopeptidase La [Elusimicrobia bacterium HGW-Elusimicrobia-1]|jgi:ATP-dependent Lon protease|nr:MAG: endopeptidase La [Elusimicrobia bacterium HGW-Elusimicrobia-1]
MATEVKPETTEKIYPPVINLLPIRDVVVFPGMIIPLAIGREKSVKAVEDAMSRDKLVFLVTQKQPNLDDPSQEDLHKIGTVAEVLQLLKISDGTLKVIVEGHERGRWSDFTSNDKGFVTVSSEILKSPAVEHTLEMEALGRRAVASFENYARLSQKVPIEAIGGMNNISDPGKLADAIVSHLSVKVSEKQQILEVLAPTERLEKTIQLLNNEIEILNIEKKIQNRVRNQIEKSQKEYYLTEQMKAIQKELRQKDDFAKELDEIRQKIKDLNMPKDARDAAEKEIQRLEKMMPFSPEATVSRTYLDWMTGLPWSTFTTDNLDIKRAEKILNEDHYGLEKTKERVLEYLAVLKLVKKIKGPILCFVGPPGVGKTSIAHSVARGLGRNFVRISLGGVRDEAEIRGHRRTYIGSLPGRIIQSMRKAKSRNPVFILDEIDKLGADWRGDPAAALLEVLDPEQNHSFTDHYLDVEFDLSDVMFITTANTLYSIPPALVDRLETIRFPGYTIEEKIKIAQNFLIPKQLKEHGIKPEQLMFEESALDNMIRLYTQEAGVRNLEREIANASRKFAKELASANGKNGPLTVSLNSQNLKKYLGIPKYFREKVSPNDVGVSTGLAWTEVGGETLTIEAALMKGSGKLLLTGKLGEVMKESAQASLSFIKSQADVYGIPTELFKDYDIHVHIPEGAIPKDGPSAGSAITTAMVSLLTKRRVAKNLAMTGEITLRGRVLPIGGLKEKLIAAYRDGITTVIYPEGNVKDLDEIPANVLKKIKLIPVKNVAEALDLALERNSAGAAKTATANKKSKNAGKKPKSARKNKRGAKR